LLVEALNDSLPHWMELVLTQQVSTSWPESVLDLCCGSGSIAIHAALLYPQARVTACDISADALSLCRENVTRHELTDSIHIVESDLFAGLNPHRFDLVLCNPPYVNDQSMAALPAEFLAEPDMALRGGNDGMDIIEQILKQVVAHMSPSGIVLLEIGHEAAHFEQRFDQLEFAYLPVAAGDQMVVALTCDQLSRARQ
jgi:ribosomal protein L3 glutamine methyltransferase